MNNNSLKKLLERKFRHNLYESSRLGNIPVSGMDTTHIINVIKLSRSVLGRRKITKELCEIMYEELTARKVVIR